MKHEKKKKANKENTNNIYSINISTTGCPLSQNRTQVLHKANKYSDCLALPDAIYGTYTGFSGLFIQGYSK